MELIIFGSLYQANEVLIFYVHFLWKNFLFTWHGRSGVAFLSYEKGFGGGKFRGPRGRSFRAFVWPFLSRCWVAFGRPFLPLGGSAGCASALESSSGLRGPSPQAFTPFGGVIAWRPKKGSADGVEGIFGLAGRVWALTLRPDPP